MGRKKGAHLLFVAGEPLKEPIAWRGPIVINTQSELSKAFEELGRGHFYQDFQASKSLERISKDKTAMVNTIHIRPCYYLLRMLD